MSKGKSTGNSKGKATFKAGGTVKKTTLVHCEVVYHDGCDSPPFWRMPNGELVANTAPPKVGLTCDRCKLHVCTECREMVDGQLWCWSCLEYERGFYRSLTHAQVREILMGA